MPKAKEFSVRIQDQPGTLGKVCRSLADQRVNIVAFQSIPSDVENVVRLVVDNPTTARSVLEKENIKYTETEVAQAKLPHRPGELARAASELGDANINIKYGYCGIEPGTNAALLFFGVSDVGKAVTILDKAVAAAAKV
jgi:hypothetical protein